MRTRQALLTEDLSFVAEALLAICERDRQRPYFSDERIASKLKRAEQRDPVYGHLAQSRGDDPLLRRECQEVIAAARLTARQTDVFFQRMEGWTFEEIGASAGHTKQAAQHIFVQALKKIARSFRVYPFKGLSEVYRGETRRGIRAGLGRIPTSAS